MGGLRSGDSGRGREGRGVLILDNGLDGLTPGPTDFENCGTFCAAGVCDGGFCAPRPKLLDRKGVVGVGGKLPSEAVTEGRRDAR